MWGTQLVAGAFLLILSEGPLCSKAPPSQLLPGFSQQFSLSFFPHKLFREPFAQDSPVLMEANQSPSTCFPSTCSLNILSAVSLFSPKLWIRCKRQRWQGWVYLEELELKCAEVWPRTFQAQWPWGPQGHTRWGAPHCMCAQA